MNWDLIDNIFLDMDGTLLDLHFDNYFWLVHLPKRLAEMRHEQEEDVRADLRGKYERLRGQLNWYCLEYWQDMLQVDIVALKREVVEKIRFRPSAEHFLKDIGEMGKHVALVSNAHRWSIDLKMESVLPKSAFDAVHSAHDFGSPKENQAHWQRLKTKTDFDPDRTLFIDDNLDVLQSAKDFGIAYLFSIYQPDLEAEPQPPSGFKQIKDFRELL